MKKTILTYGFLSGAIAAVLMVVTGLYYHSNPDFKNGAVYGYAGILLSMAFVFLGVRAYRDKTLGGSISFGTAFKVGILITLISCVCYVVAWLVVYETLMPDFMEKYISYSLNELKETGASAEKINQFTQEMEGYKSMYENPIYRFLLTFTEPFPVGLLVTLISAIVLRKNQP